MKKSKVLFFSFVSLWYISFAFNVRYSILFSNYDYTLADIIFMASIFLTFCALVFYEFKAKEWATILLSSALIIHPLLWMEATIDDLIYMNPDTAYTRCKDSHIQRGLEITPDVLDYCSKL